MSFRRRQCRRRRFRSYTARTQPFVPNTERTKTPARRGRSTASPEGDGEVGGFSCVFRAATGIEPSVWAGSRGAETPAEGRHRNEKTEYRFRDWGSQARSKYLLMRILRMC